MATLTASTASFSLDTYLDKVFYNKPLIPDSDDTVGGWTTNTGSSVNLYQAVDETIRDDSDYIRNPGGGVYEYVTSLSNISSLDPDSLSIIVRYERENIGDIDLTIRLYEGVSKTLIAYWVYDNVSDSIVTRELYLSDAEFASINNLDDLYLGFESSAAEAYVTESNNSIILEDASGRLILE